MEVVVQPLDLPTRRQTSRAFLPSQGRSVTPTRAVERRQIQPFTAASSAAAGLERQVAKSSSWVSLPSAAGSLGQSHPTPCGCVAASRSIGERHFEGSRVVREPMALHTQHHHPRVVSPTPTRLRSAGYAYAAQGHEHLLSTTEDAVPVPSHCQPRVVSPMPARTRSTAYVSSVHGQEQSSFSTTGDDEMAMPVEAKRQLMSRLSALQEKLSIVQHYHETLLGSARHSAVADRYRGRSQTLREDRASSLSRHASSRTDIQRTTAHDQPVVILESSVAPAAKTAKQSREDELLMLGALQEIFREQQQMKEEQQSKVARLEQQVVQLEQALLMQSAQQEQELLSRYQELDLKEEALRQRNLGLRQRAAQAAALTAVSSCTALASSSASNAPAVMQPPQDTASSCTMFDTWAAPVIAAEAVNAVPSSSSRCPPESDQRDCAGSQGVWDRDGTVPEVYKAAISIITRYGWAALHGGENGGAAWTVFHWAASEGRTSLCERLLQLHADPLHVDEAGKMPIDYAEEAGHLDTALLLRRHMSMDSFNSRLANDSQPLPHEVATQSLTVAAGSVLATGVPELGAELQSV